MNAKGPCPEPQQLVRLLLGETTEQDGAELERHVLNCLACGERLRRLEAEDTLVSALRGQGDRNTVGAQDQQEVAALIRKLTDRSTPDGAPTLSHVPEAGDEPSIPHLADYEISEVLGRGGMGVVYRARQVSLKRLVAIKMILGQGRPQPQMLARFRAEAEAVARLHHPNIVHIYAISEHEGCPYLALEFADGGSLDKAIGGKPQAARTAAQVVQVIARAIQHAHQHHVVHRDLKPSNILLRLPDGAVGGPDLTSAIPKVTDFGLAKQLDDDSGQTQTGAIVGTPSYMAPEQAAGNPQGVGPAADIYALGAILYEMLTGRPPFRGANPIATIEQVLNKELTPPSKLARVPRDLETVCLKALAKEPQRRYTSALALAQDLERFLAGEPILARREGLTRRLWRKVRRHPAAAATSLILFMAILGAATWFWNWNQRNRDAGQLLHRIDAAIDVPELNQAYLDRMTGELEALQALDADAAEGARKRFHTRFARLLEDSIRKPTLPAQELAQLDTWLDKLASLAPGLVPPLRIDLAQRKAGWDPELRLEGPGAEYQALFEPGQVSAQQEVLIRTDPAPLLVTRRECGNHDEFTATFDERWESAAGIGVVLNCVQRHEGEINSLAFAPDGQALASASGYRENAHSPMAPRNIVRVWDLAGKERFSYRPENRGAVSLAYFPDGRALVVASTGASVVRLLDPTTGKILHEFVAHEGAGIGALAVSHDNQTLVTGSGVAGKFGEVRLWDTKNWTLRKKLTGFENIVLRVAQSRDGRFVAGADRGRAVKVFELATGAAKLTGRPFFFESNDNTLIFTSDSRTLIAPANLDQPNGAVLEKVVFWDAATGATRQVHLGVLSSALNGLALTPDDETLVAASGWSGEIRAVNLKSGSARLIHRHDLPYVTSSLAISPDGGTLAVGTFGGSIELRRLSDGQLRTSFENRGYTFAIRAEPEAGQPISMKNAREKKARLRLSIERNRQVLRSESLSADQVPAGPLQLLARRDGNHLVFQINRLPPLEFEELQPLPAVGTFALSWPGGIGLKSLHAKRRQTPGSTSPLERGDELFVRNDYVDALALYREQTVATGTRDKQVGQEARLKAALCMLRLERLSDAMPELERLAGEGESRWSAVAACELLTIYLREGRLQDADVLFDRLTDTVPFQAIQSLLSTEFRNQLLNRFMEDSGESRWGLRPRDMDLKSLARATKIFDYFQVPSSDRQALRWAYMRAYHYQGKLDLAAKVAEEALLHEQTGGPEPNRYGMAAVLEILSSILREQGHAEKAIERIGGFLDGNPGLGTHHALLLERARAHIALKQWDLAEQDLDRCLHGYSPSYSLHAQAALAQGFVRERRGDVSGALQAWKRGVYENYLALRETTGKPGTRAQAPALGILSGADALFGAAVASLADELSGEDADRILESLIRRLAREKGAISLIQERITMPPGILRDMWRSPLGRDCARKLAFRDVAVAETLRVPIVLLGAEYVQQTAMPRPASAEQQELVWLAADRLHRAHMEEKVPITQSVGLVLTWKGTTNFLGWAGIAPTMEPSLRGPLAYVIGQRYLSRLQRPDDALAFFRTAVSDAPPDSLLKRLAQMEVDRLAKTADTKTAK